MPKKEERDMFFLFSLIYCKTIANIIVYFWYASL